MDKLGRPEWDDYFIALTFLISLRSLDKHTKCGCVVVGEENSILSTGYNSPPRGCNDSKIPLERPHKYAFMEHAESNAIINAARIGTPLKNSIFYITGPPCNTCFGKIISVGAKKIVYGPSTHSTHEKEKDIIDLMKENQKIIVEKHKNNVNVSDLLSSTHSRYAAKVFGRK